MPAKKAGGKGAKPGGKAPAAAVLAMKKKREEELRQQELEAQLAKEQEEKERAEDEERERKEKEAAERKRLKKQEDREQVASGAKLGAAEQKRLEANRKKIEQLKASGVVMTEEMIKKLEGAGGDDQKGDGKKKKAAIATKMKKKPAPKAVAKEEEKPAVKEDDDEDGWEAEADTAVAEQEKEAAAKRAKAEKKRAEMEAKAEGGGGDVADDWEDDADEDEEEDNAPAEVQDEPEEQAPKPQIKMVANAKKQENGDKGIEKVYYQDPNKDKKAEKGAVDGKEPPMDLRSPIVTVLGHVDTGKTKLLDCIRRTNVQAGEAGGITQQIGASFFPIENIMTKTKTLHERQGGKMELTVPGLLVIDTPGHEAFQNLRSRGSSMCDIAILVVDIMAHGLEQQVLSSIKLLRDKKCYFIVALNKIDRLYEWEPHKDKDFAQTYEAQKAHVQDEFKRRLAQFQTWFKEQGLNADLYTNNLQKGRAGTYVSFVPTSAITGEGISDLLLLLVHLTQKFMSKKVAYSDSVQCTCLEKRVIEGLGLTIDVILINGMLREGDTIVCCGLNGAVVTQVRALLTPQPMKEIRVKTEYVHHKEIKAAMGIKIAAHNLETVIPGAPLLVAKAGDDLDQLKDEVQKDIAGLISRPTSDVGVTVQSSSFGALEALLVYLKEEKIPVANVGVGPINKKDVMKACGMKDRNPKFSVILAFDVPIMPEGRDMADREGVKIFTADIIYHLSDSFNKYIEEYTQALMEKNKALAVFPCHLKLHPGAVFNKKNPIVLGVDVVEGQLRPGCEIFTWKAPEEGKRKQPFRVGRIESVQLDEKELPVHRGGKPVAIKIKAREETMTFGRQIDEGDEYWSYLRRESIDALKESFRGEMQDSDWKLVIKLKKDLGII